MYSVRKRGRDGRRGAAEKEVWRPSSSDGNDIFVRVMCSTAVQVLIARARWNVADGTICIGPIHGGIRGDPLTTAGIGQRRATLTAVEK